MILVREPMVLDQLKEVPFYNRFEHFVQLKVVTFLLFESVVFGIIPAATNCKFVLIIASPNNDRRSMSKAKHLFSDHEYISETPKGVKHITI